MSKIFAEGRVRPVIDGVYPFPAPGRPWRSWRGPAVRKVVLRVD